MQLHALEMLHVAWHNFDKEMHRYKMVFQFQVKTEKEALFGFDIQTSLQRKRRNHGFFSWHHAFGTIVFPDVFPRFRFRFRTSANQSVLTGVGQCCIEVPKGSV